ncbi:type ISP restriction/modification enzyme [Crocosphaera sp.]|uniref:type ISP restriction/modification enzyme n=1 Tax=Crocosphaera sp. TaxID=2729996 RepID=UPI0026194568|nr:type ISP restriction/modification enzyme [Crocosphaera sp.]MDJ0581449.1 N-6 DNA methylase [Crocosphaera sp.]
MNYLATYFRNLYEIYSTGAGVAETSYYGALETLLNDVGNILKPKVRCIINLKNQGAGLPDGGLFTANQFRKNKNGQPFNSIYPERGVIEVKGTKEDVNKIANSEQVIRYWEKYRQVLVTNYREFLLIGEDKNGKRVKLESYSFADNETDFWSKLSQPEQLVQQESDRFLEYLRRVMLSVTSITSPEEVAWFLASYAKDAKSRLEQQHNLPALQSIRTALEEALGITFEGEKGDRFFRSTLIQTLFYGIFSAWVLWHKENPKREDDFNWQTAAYYLHVPMIQAIFERIAAPSKLKALDLVEVLNWTGSALNRVRREDFFTQFNEGEAVQYFYEPFLQAFDPQLRKELGVWYTPKEIVKYMVSRVDTVLKEELNIEDGLADDNVYILDPCCGTGAYLVEVLHCIATTLEEKGEGALSIASVKKAAIERVFGFEILTAPFVVSHLQLGLVLQNLGVPLSEENERVGVYLTNALTGWEPPDETSKKQIKQLELYFPELSKEREAADEVKQGKPILVILGNPPYNAFAGTSPQEEGGLVEPYKEGLISEWGIKKFNLDELYVRFFRLAERCISESTGKGVVCYISNFSYLSDPSYVVMRQRFINDFDKLWFDCLNGDSRETGKKTPDGKPDPSVFSTQYNKAGIKLGTTVGLMVRKDIRQDTSNIYFRHFWGVDKRQKLLNSLNNNQFDSSYDIAKPQHHNRYSFRPVNINSYYLEWLKITDLCEESPISGLQEMRKGSLMSIDKDILIKRMEIYYDSSIDWNTFKTRNIGLAINGGRFDAQKCRSKMQKEEKFEKQKIQKYSLYPFDFRWCYYSSNRPLWNEPRPALVKNNFKYNKFIVVRMIAERPNEQIPIIVTSALPDYHLLRPNAVAIPIQIRLNVDHNKAKNKQKELFNTDEYINTKPQANLSEKSRQYLRELGLTNPDENQETASLIWMHVLAIGYSPQYLQENEDGIRQDFPRIPLPNTRELLYNSATLGQQIAALLDTENNVSGVTNKLREELKNIALISHTQNQQLNPDDGDLNVTAGWGHENKKGVTMPGKGKAIERPYTTTELAILENSVSHLNMSLETILEQLGNTTYDIYLNDIAYWKNIPSNVYNYTIGGYQVIKKWLSYREEKLLGRSLSRDEVREVRNMARRLTAITLLQPQLNENYQQVKQHTYNWPNS